LVVKQKDSVLVAEMLAVFLCTALALDMKKDRILMNSAAVARQGGHGMREDASLKKKKAQSICGKDTMTCGNGVEVYRDPTYSCRFLPCDSPQTSLIEQTPPTFHWQGASISDEQNFCARMTPLLGDYTDLAVPACGPSGANPNGLPEETCENHYVHVLDGKVGDIEHCRWNGNQCEDGAVHNCTWSFYMEDLIKKHASSTDNCAAKLLEAKRSLDGLLHSVQDVYNQLMQWNTIVHAENMTVREALAEQRDDWRTYESTQLECDQTYIAAKANRTYWDELLAEMTELRAIANPDVRSAVDVNRARGYQSSGTTSESCPAQYPFVNLVTRSYCCTSQNEYDINANPVDHANCTLRDCRDAYEQPVDCVNNARTPNGEGLLSPSETAAAAAASSFVEVDSRASAKACEKFQSLLQSLQRRAQRKLGKTLAAMDVDCHTGRDWLQGNFTEVFTQMGNEYNSHTTMIEEDRRRCMNDATYEYKSAVEGLGGIDDRIQNSAGKIHTAQNEIARLEPILHDVERAAGRVRAYVQTVNEQCANEGYLGHIYEDIRQKIQDLMECPGRNDFILDVPHWSPLPDHTPAPTPWYDDPKATDAAPYL